MISLASKDLSPRERTLLAITREPGPRGQLYRTMRQEKVVELLLQGMTYRAVGRTLGISHTQVRTDLKEVLDARIAQMPEVGEEVRAFQMGVLEEVMPLTLRNLHQVLTEKVVLGVDPDGNPIKGMDYKAQASLSTTLMKQMKRQAELTGADVPKKLEIDSTEAAKEQILHEKAANADEMFKKMWGVLEHAEGREPGA